MRQRERDWIKEDNTQDLTIGFNTKPGGEGGPKIHIPVRLLAECIAEGLSPLDIKIELENHGIYLSITTLRRRIIERYGSFIEARRKFLKPVLKQLIKEGYRKKAITECFKAKNKKFHLETLIPKLFGGAFSSLRKAYLLKFVSTLLETGIQDLTYSKIHSFLPLFGKYEIMNLIRGKWDGISNARVQFGREIAIHLFRKGASDEYILRALGYSENTIRIEESRDRTFKGLFDGMTADEAREHFTFVYISVEGHFIWYSDLDNY